METAISSHPLNPQQQQIINHIEGAVLVLAPVGTGKTQVLSERVVNALRCGIPASKVLCLTFTNRAAKEMSERLAQTCPQDFREITIKTFHGLCTSMLRIEARHIGLPADFMVYDDSDCIGLIKEIFNISQDKDARDIFFHLAECKNKARSFQLSPDYSLEELFASLGKHKAQLASEYQATLQERHSLDFADLIFYTRSMLHSYPEIQQRWQERFDFLQVDEVQDTHLSEYEIVRYLASQTGNLSMIGDLDQTIYEWRGSEPDKVINQFKQDFQPINYSLKLNYRATQTLLNAASAFADSFEHRYTQIKPAPSCKLGEPIGIYNAKTEREEAQWIGEQIKKLADNNSNFAYNRVAVLTRNHKRVNVITQGLEKLNVPCINIEQHQFFMRQEIKDALAYLRLVINPFDTGSMRRMLLRPSRGIGEVTIKNIINEGESCGFRLTDMASPQTFVDGDPFRDLLNAYTTGTIVVFDVETTGFSASEDEIIEVAAVKLIRGEIKAEFKAYITNTVPVGTSEQVHGYSDQFLAVHGKPAKQVLQDFLEFVNDAFLVGHNVGFDIKMLVAHAQKVGLSTPKFQWADTWNLAKRFIEADSYRLERLAEQLHLTQYPSHHALEDAQTTVELLQYLIPKIQHRSDYRQALVYRYGDNFEDLATQIETWRDASQKNRPANLLGKILVGSGLYDYYQNKEPQRLQNIKNLVSIFQQKDDLDLHPDTALRSIIEYIALAKNLDQVSKDNNQVLVITVHQAKGLEFDTVFLAGISQNEFPSYFSVRDNKEEEEKRLFYVAITRAKERLFISTFQRDTYGFKSPSPFISVLSPQYTRWLSN